MDKKITQKIQVLIDKAKEGKTYTDSKGDATTLQSNVTNSLADNIKTKEQAKSFMTLLQAL